MDENDFVSCPNCDCLTAFEDMRPISIGAIYRHAKSVERAQHLLVKSGQMQSQDGRTIPLETLFSDLKMNWVPMPPVLESLKYNIQEIGRHEALQNKDTHVCLQCFEVYADDAEVKHRLESDASAARLKKMRGVPSAPPGATGAVVPQGYSRDSDRRRDFAFTSLQATIRSREKVIDDKRRARKKLVELQSTDIDWESLPATAGKEIRRIQDSVAALAIVPDPHELRSTSKDKHALVERSPHRSSSARRVHSPISSPARSRMGSARSLNRLTYLPQVLGEPLTDEEMDQIAALSGAIIPVTEDPKCAFDVPLQHRFMHELWSRMCSEMEFGSEDSYLHLTDARGDHMKQRGHPTPINVPSAKPEPRISVAFATEENSGQSPTAKVIDMVPVRHPFFLLYRKNQLRLPTPPVPLMVKKPTVVSTAANVEDAILRVDNLILKNSKDIKRIGMKDAFLFKDLTAEEQELLATVVGDPTIIVDENDDGDDLDFESDEEEEEYIEEDEDGFDDY